MVDEGNYGSAAGLLHSLLWSKLAPKYFWVTLLIDAIPFLTADQLLFTSEQTYELLQCLQAGYFLIFLAFRFVHCCGAANFLSGSGRLRSQSRLRLRPKPTPALAKWLQTLQFFILRIVFIFIN